MIIIDEQKIIKITDALRTILKTDKKYTLDDIPNALWLIVPEDNPTIISDWAYSTKYGLNSISNENVIEVGAHAFQIISDLEQDSSLMTVNFPKVTILREKCFYNCYNLTNVTFGDISIIEDSAMYNIGDIDLITFGGDSVSIGNYAFYNSGLKKVEFKDTIKQLTIGSNVFCYTKINSLDIPSETQVILSDESFSDMSELVSVIFNTSTLTSFGNSTFSDCTSLTTLPDMSSLTSIGDGAFSNCTSLTTLPDMPALTTIRDNAFSNCTSLKLFIFFNLTTCGAAPFYNCTNLLNVFCASDDQNVEVPSTCKVWKGLSKEELNKISSAVKEGTYEELLVTPTSITINGLDKAYSNYAGIYTVMFTPVYLSDTSKGVTWSIVSDTSKASIDDNGKLSVTENIVNGEIIKIRATSTYNDSLYGEYEVTYASALYPASVLVNGNDGQWIDSGTKVDDNIVYKSDAGSYHVANGLSRAIVTVIGYSTCTVYIRSYAESSPDYTELGPLDASNISRGASTNVLSTKGKSSSTDYQSYTFTLPDLNAHTFEIIYSKDSSVNSNDDRGYFYVTFTLHEAS